jgi:DNA-directed RNA polymerase specialized sigma24 family protein
MDSCILIGEPVMLRFGDDEPAPSVPEFGDWVSSHAHQLLRFAHLVAGSVDGGEKALEGALVSAYQGWDDLVRSTDPEAHVRRAIIDGQTARWRRRPEPAGDAVACVPAGSRQALWGRYLQLAASQRAVLVMRLVEGIAVEDIAVLLDREQQEVRDELDRCDRRLATGLDAATRRDVRRMVAELLRQHGQTTPAPADLAGRAVSAVRSRRRKQTVGGVLAVLALLVPAAWLADPAGEPARPDDRLPDIPVSEVPEWRWESYGGIEVQVPATWEHGDLTQWCAAAAGSARSIEGPAVHRPQLGTSTGPRALCSINGTTGTRGVDRPTYTAGLLLRPTGAEPVLGRADVAEEAKIYSRRLGEVDLTVVDQTPVMAQRILGSATLVEGTDSYGCAPTVQVPRFGRFLSVRQVELDSVDEAESVSICRYQIDRWPRPTLYASVSLGRAPSREIVGMLQAAPSVDVPPRTVHRCTDSDVILLRVWDDGQPITVWVHHGMCDARGVDDGARPRRLPAALLRLLIDRLPT